MSKYSNLEYGTLLIKPNTYKLVIYEVDVELSYSKPVVLVCKVVNCVCASDVKFEI